MPYPLASTVLMVPPVHMAFNKETAKDNAYQHDVAMSQRSMRAAALNEFSMMVTQLTNAGVGVVVLKDKTPVNETPDAVFPNNWFSTDPSGKLFIYPMLTNNRQREVKPDLLASTLSASNLAYQQWIDLKANNKIGIALEGTGVLIFDRQANTVFAALSNRCHLGLLKDFCAKQGITPVTFNTKTQHGKPVYHTNVMMSIGNRFAVICDDVIDTADRNRVLESLEHKHIIRISEYQMEQFCGNILQLCTKKGEPVIAMSQTAFNAFTNEQRQQLSEFGQLLAFDIPVIETVGGGSVRCMLAELF